MTVSPSSFVNVITRFLHLYLSDSNHYCLFLKLLFQLYAKPSVRFPLSQK
jgi:hypothetical protein